MAFDINGVRGLQGVSVGVRGLTLPAPGLFGVSVVFRETLDTAGLFGVSVGLRYTAALQLQPTNFGAVAQPLTITIGWAGHTAEVYSYGPDFVSQRDLPLNTAITVQCSGAAYTTTTTTFTLNSTVPVAVNVPVTIAAPALNAYRRRRPGP